MDQRRQLRVLIMGRQENFDRVLATNIQCWGYEAVVVPPSVMLGGERASEVEGDVLLYDLDESLRTITGKENSNLQSGLLVPGILRGGREQWFHTRLTIVLSSRSVSRTMLEQMGAVAMLQKPFEMGRLQRYLRVLQRLVFSEEAEGVKREEVTGKNIRVLVVDDDVDVAQAIRQCLIYEPGYEVAVAHDGLEALEQCLDWQPQCVVTDLIMPWMNGYQVMRCLSLSALHTMPAFVIMSALTQLEVPVNRSYLKGKAVAYVDKPFHIDHLLTAIKHVCVGAYI